MQIDRSAIVWDEDVPDPAAVQWDNEPAPVEQPAPQMESAPQEPQQQSTAQNLMDAYGRIKHLTPWAALPTAKGLVDTVSGVVDKIPSVPRRTWAEMGRGTGMMGEAITEELGRESKERYGTDEAAFQQVTDPKELVGAAAGAIAFPAQVVQSAQETVKGVLGLRDEEQPDGETLGEFFGGWIKPYADAIKGDTKALEEKVLYDPIGAAFDAAIVFGVAKGGKAVGKKGYDRVKTVHNRKQFSLEMADLLDRADAEGMPATQTRMELEKLAKKRGVDFDTFQQAFEYVQEQRRNIPEERKLLGDGGIVSGDGFEMRGAPAPGSRIAVGERVPETGARLIGDGTALPPARESIGEGFTVRDRAPGDPNTIDVSEPIHRGGPIAPPGKEATTIGYTPPEPRLTELAQQSVTLPKPRHMRILEEVFRDTKKKLSEKSGQLGGEKIVTGVDMIEAAPRKIDSNVIKTQYDPGSGIGMLERHNIRRGTTGGGIEALIENGPSKEFISAPVKELGWGNIKYREYDISKLDNGIYSVPARHKATSIRGRVFFKIKDGKIEEHTRFIRGKGDTRTYQKWIDEELNGPQTLQDKISSKLKDAGGAIKIGKTPEQIRRKQLAKGFEARLKNGRQRKSTDLSLDIPPAERGKLAQIELNEDMHTPVEHNQYSKGSVDFLKSGEIDDYVRSVPRHKGKPIEPGSGRSRDKAAKIGEMDQSLPAPVQAEVEALRGTKDIAKWDSETHDIRRLAQQIDGGENGPVSKQVLWTSRDGMMANDTFVSRHHATLDDILVRNDISNKASNARVWDAMDGRPPEGLKPNEARAAQELREWSDRVRFEVNKARRARGQEEIPYRNDWISYVAERNMMDVLLDRQARPKWATGKAAPPDFMKPSKTHNPHELARKLPHDAYAKNKNIGEILGDYAKVSGRDIFYTDIIQNNKKMIKALREIGKDNSANAIETWTNRSFAGVLHGIDKAIEGGPSMVRVPAKIQQRISRGLKRSVFPANLAWNVAIQTTSHAQLAPRTSFTAMTKALPLMFDPKYRARAQQGYVYHKKVKSPSQYAGELGETRGGKFKYVDKKGKLDTVADKIGYLTNMIERELTIHAGITADLHAKKLGLKGRERMEFIGETQSAVNSMYNFEDLPGFLQSKNVTASVPFQTFVFEAKNNLKEILGKTGHHKMMGQAKTKRLLKWAASMYVANAISNVAVGRSPWEWESFVPFSSVGSGFWGTGGRYGRESEFVFTSYGNAFTKALNDAVVDNDWNATRKLVMRYHVPAGTQMNRFYEAWQAWDKGGRVKNKNGKTIFKIAPDEHIRSYFVGPWATEQGRKHQDDRFTAWMEDVPEIAKPAFPLVPGGKKYMELKDKREKASKK